MSAGRVARQIYHVHVIFLDMLISTDGISNLERRCRCRIVPLLHKNPHALSCPPMYRALEVTFEKGCQGDPIGLWQSLQRLAEFNPEMVRLAVSVLCSTDSRRCEDTSELLSTATPTYSTEKHVSSVCEVYDI